MTQASPGQFFGQGFGQTEQQNQQHSLQHQRGARARPFIVSVPAVVSVVLFDQNLDQKIDLGWPGSSPGLAQVKPWAGPGSSPWEDWPKFLKALPNKKPLLKQVTPSSDALADLFADLLADLLADLVAGQPGASLRRFDIVWGGSAPPRPPL